MCAESRGLFFAFALSSGTALPFSRGCVCGESCAFLSVFADCVAVEIASLRGACVVWQTGNVCAVGVVCECLRGRRLSVSSGSSFTGSVASRRVNSSTSSAQQAYPHTIASRLRAQREW
jgi:hypothetical protein